MGARFRSWWQRASKFLEVFGILVGCIKTRMRESTGGSTRKNVNNPLSVRWKTEREPHSISLRVTAHEYHQSQWRGLEWSQPASSASPTCHTQSRQFEQCQPSLCT